MDVTDGDRYAIAMAKLSQARSAVYEATRIIEHLFESDRCTETSVVLPVHIPDVSATHDPDITGLYPGQQAPPPDYSDVDPEEESEVETTECLD